VRYGVGRVVIDHAAEVEHLISICEEMARRQAVWLRINPGVEVETHTHLQTGAPTSKFGISINDDMVFRVVESLHTSNYLPLKGIHFHLGSQLADMSPIRQAFNLTKQWLTTLEFKWTPAEISPGGGWAIPYTSGNQRLYPREALASISDSARAINPAAKLIIEPGRELIARAGIALYRVGALKQVGELLYAFLDGGMADNPRPAMYGSDYYAVLANRHKTPYQHYTLAGPFCESGDILIHHIKLPVLKEGDLLAIPVSGAYQLSMASNYNEAPRPAVLWLHNNNVQVAQQRETFNDLWQRDRLVKVDL
jgi:diaminopimelate decarboxylase